MTALCIGIAIARGQLVSIETAELHRKSVEKEARCCRLDARTIGDWPKRWDLCHAGVKASHPHLRLSAGLSLQLHAEACAQSTKHEGFVPFWSVGQLAYKRTQS